MESEEDDRGGNENDLAKAIVPTERSRGRRASLRIEGKRRLREERIRYWKLKLSGLKEERRRALVEAPAGEAEAARLQLVCSSSTEESAYARVKKTLRIFSRYRLYYIREEEKRCRRAGADGSPRKRPDLKAISKMIATNAILYPKKVGALDGIPVGSRFSSRAEMVVLGLHGHWLKGIDHLSASSGRFGEYRRYTFPIAVSVVISGEYEDDLDNLDEVVYCGHGGNGRLGKERRDQTMAGGNLALRNSMEQGVPIRVIRGHVSRVGSLGKVFTYGGLYRVVGYWDGKGISGFTVFRYLLRRLPDQPPLATTPVRFTGHGGSRRANRGLIRWMKHEQRRLESAASAELTHSVMDAGARSEVMGGKRISGSC